MAQKPYEEDGDKPEDYEFREEQDDIDYEYQQDEGGGKKRFKWRRLLLFLIIVLAVLWFFYHQYEHKKATQAAQEEEQTTPAVSTVGQPPAASSEQTKKKVPQQQSAPKVSGATQAAVINSSALSAAQAKLMADNASMRKVAMENKQQLSQLQTQVAQLNRTVNVLLPEAQRTSLQVNQLTQTVQFNQANITQKLAAMNRDLSTVVKQLQVIESAREAEEQTKMTAQARKEAAIRHRQRYFVQAVIPGRAWLKSANGKTVTVAVGDIIDGYGKILAIDPYSGDVVTSSGVIIKYGLG